MKLLLKCLKFLLSVVCYFQAVLQFWLQQGVDGFRVDAILTLFEPEDVLIDEPRSYKEDVGPVSLFTNFFVRMSKSLVRVLVRVQCQLSKNIFFFPKTILLERQFFAGMYLRLAS
jgi:glycosidase